MYCTFEVMTSFMADSKLYNFVRTDQNTIDFVQGFFSINLLKLYHKNRGGFLASGPL